MELLNQTPKVAQRQTMNNNVKYSIKLIPPDKHLHSRHQQGKEKLTARNLPLKLLDHLHNIYRLIYMAVL